MSSKASIIKEANKYIARGQIDNAIAEWEKLIKEYPDGNAYNTIGDLYLKSGNKTIALDSFHEAAKVFRQEGFSLKSIALYKKILNINSADYDALFFLGELTEEKGIATDATRYYLAAADILSRAGNIDRLFELYQRVLALSPTDILLRNKVAELHVKEGNLSEAAHQYAQIAKLHSDKRDLDMTMRYYEKALDIDPSSKEAILGLNYLYENLGDLQKALEQMKEAISLFPHDIDFYLRDAEIHIAAEKINEAEEILRKVKETEPNNTQARKLLGDIYEKKGDRKKAWTEYIPAIDAMIGDEKNDDAINLLESFRDIDPLETGKRLVSIYRHIGEKGQIVNELTQLGEVLEEKGMHKEALKCFKEALAIHPDETIKNKIVELEREVRKDYISIKVDKMIDEVFQEVDMDIEYSLYENAKNTLEAFKQKEPDNIDLHVRLKSVYTVLGDREQAVTECLILHELYEKIGDSKRSEEIIKEAFEISPEDQRLSRLADTQKETTIADSKIIEPEETQKPPLETDVMGAFKEFKKGLEKELSKDDYKTHYNLGIGYKEMGLIDDAIREFQISRNDMEFLLSASNMLSICYKEKGLYPLAINVLKDVIEKMKEQDETYWAMKYDLADAYEKDKSIKEALDTYAEVYGWNSNFRDVSEKIDQLGSKIAEDAGKKKPGKKDRVSYL